MEGCEIPLKVAKEMIKVLGVNVGVNAHEARDVTWLGVLKKRVDFFSRMLQKSSYIACMLGVSDLPDQSN